jgi:hypothetical protein
MHILSLIKLEYKIELAYNHTVFRLQYGVMLAPPKGDLGEAQVMGGLRTQANQFSVKSAERIAHCHSLQTLKSDEIILPHVAGAIVG